MRQAILFALFAAAGALTLSAADYKAPKTTWGEPDLQGVWSSAAELGVPFERNPSYGDRQWLTDDEFNQRLKQTAAQIDSDNAEFTVDNADISNAGAVGSATSPPPHWLERSETSRRTSLVIDPPDGRVPPMTTEGRARLAATPPPLGNGPFDGPEQMSMWVRCIARGVPSAMFPTVYNANTRIAQGPGYVGISYEMIHDTRLIPTDGRPHVRPGIRMLYGDSTARWDGDTLVIDATNFTGKLPFRGSSDALHMTERFRRIDKDLVRYEVTVDDPRTWTRPWTAALDLRRQSGGMFEYACHEGNYSMLNILKGSRAADKR
ncbi:MAG TPA: hypothetical protein VLV86_09165 [Vicinamibacterales bacterium]|nr:hypothetical protein [Vicinamibacterales bacterium]